MKKVARWQCGLVIAGSLWIHSAIGAPGTHAAPNPGTLWTLPLGGTPTLKMAWISPGTFIMGSPASEPLRADDEAPITRVTLTRGFWLGTTLVTIGQWRAVMGRDVRAQLQKALRDDTVYDFDGRPKTLSAYLHFKRDADPGEYLTGEADDLPMYYVSWFDAVAYCRALNAREHAAARLPPGYEYTLPTEAQWEYASRAGTRTATFAGPLPTHDQGARVPDGIAWYDANSSENYHGQGWLVNGHNAGPHAVAHKHANLWGLYDTAGNLWEWCRDWYGPYAGGARNDPTGPASGSARVNRGGSFGSGARDQRPASRARNPPAEASAFRGFRLALAVR